MIKIYFLVVSTLTVGAVLGWFAKSAWLRFLARRDKQVTTQVEEEYVRMRVNDIPTDQLVDELSTRDDILRPSYKVER